ncbi:MAG: hypothetical protein A2Y67_03675 [Candidatus Buchananbacteria bacterium RBG_13_39_9]|uniref:Uncharacterized protein n=1 Tax=Candidatus Buchananbacteria bacterium RBG_13_39_9 TaxID=1797531 RepID=A0A1G1XRU6_9BACT|nr:MAG: hypothetical protein A2Y67_03675 [Candidatus Buchananbacteria bacterium RBG_13_39_9]
MERITVLSTNKSDWPAILDLFTNKGLEVQEKKMNDLEWEFTVTGLEGILSTLRDKLKEKTPQTVCTEISTFYKLLFTIDANVENLYELLDEIGQKFHVDIRRGHLSENGWHISIEDAKKILEQIKTFLSQRNITASLF